MNTEPEAMQLDPVHYDAVVVGGRAAGAATAMLLARSGRRILVLDRGRRGTDTLSTHGLMRAGVLQLSRWGILGRVIAAPTPPIHRTTFTYARERVAIAIKPSHGVDALYAPRRTVLDPILVDAADVAGAEFRFGTTVTAVRRDRSGRIVGVVGRNSNGGWLTVGTDLVIGADGARSTIADLVRAPFERVGSGATAVAYRYVPGLDADGYEWIYRPGGVAGVIPTNAGQACVFAGVAASRLRTRRSDLFGETLAVVAPQLAARVAARPASGRGRTFPGHPGFIRRSWGPGWALVGDAGYWTDPIGAHGLSAALRDAELLARAVISSDAAGPDRDTALADYQATRDRLSASLFDITDTIAGHRWSDGEIGDLLRRLSASMSDELDALIALDAASGRRQLERARA